MTQHWTTRKGFTLIELAIVLAVIGVLSVGLWRILSTGNQQLKDSATANQQEQLITAVKNFLGSSNGQAYMSTNSPAFGPGANFPIPLPTVAPAGGSNAACIASLSGQEAYICNFLPLGFTASSANSYGQIYTIRGLRDNTAQGTAPTTYSFMIVTTCTGAGSGCTQISDTDGGNISSQIGAEGGFLYSNNICSASNTHISCGAYGAWTQDIATYGFGYPATGGYVASRSYATPDQSANLYWLARVVIPNDPTYSFNTMQPSANLYMSGSASSSNIYLAPYNTTTGGSTIYLQGGSIQSNSSATSDLSTISLTGNGNVPTLNVVTPGTTAGNPGVNIATGCTKSNANDATCQWGLKVTGDTVISGLLQSNAFYSNSDIRLKKNIRPMTGADALGGIMRLKPVEFTFKLNGTDSLGVIAQDVERVYPQLVSPGDAKNMAAVNYQGLIAPLIGAVQELKRENDDLRRQLQEQGRRADRLERTIKTEKAP